MSHVDLPVYPGLPRFTPSLQRQLLFTLPSNTDCCFIFAIIPTQSVQKLSRRSANTKMSSCSLRDKDQLEALSAKELLPAFSPSDSTLGTQSNTVGQWIFGIIPPHPVKSVMQRGGAVKVNWNMLHCDASQLQQIKQVYDSGNRFHRLFERTETHQLEAKKILEGQKLDIRSLEDLGNGWSKRWSNNQMHGKSQRVLLQCQSGSSTVGRQEKDAKRDAKKRSQTSKPSPTKQWKRKIPYDFTECLAHLDITFNSNDFMVLRITGILDHNEACKSQAMKRLPAVPLHPHVWQIALQQLNDGASLTAIQSRNRELLQSKLYHGQSKFDATTANVRYHLLPSDTCRLYRKQAAQDGIDLTNPAEVNVDNWLNKEHANYNPNLAKVVFGYHGRMSKDARFKLCLHTEEMRDAAWKYAHKQQLILDGTFGVCNSRILLFIAMAINDDKKGLPVAFLLFSAPTGNKATHAGYNTEILTELLGYWKTSLGKCGSEDFCPKVAITDTDTKERAALLTVWPTILLLLCKFHIRQCWTNKRKALLTIGKKYNFDKIQIQGRLQALEESLLKSITYDEAAEKIQQERTMLTSMSQGTGCNAAAKHGLTFLNYLTDTWMSNSLWQSWSLGGKIRASELLQVNIDGVIPTTNHLEAFNGVLKSKYLHQAKHKGRRLRLDLLVYLLAFRILPEIFKQHGVVREYKEWLSTRFKEQTGGVDISKQKRSKDVTANLPPVAWWDADSESTHQEAAAEIVRLQRIRNYNWLNPYTLSATCAQTAADIRQPNYLFYSVRISGYGWADCSCPYFMSSKGACKHLWALRSILKAQRLPFLITYPTTRADALKIASCFSSSDKDSLSEHTVGCSLPLDNLTSVGEEVNTTLQEITAGEATSSSEEPSDSKDSSAGCSDDGRSDSETNIQQINVLALRQQLQSRLEHELTNLLPRLHGLSILLEEEARFPVENKMFSELHDVICKIYNLSENRCHGRSSDTSSNLVLDKGKGKAQAFNPSTQLVSSRLVLPPSPERSQARKRSHAIH